MTMSKIGLSMLYSLGEPFKKMIKHLLKVETARFRLTGS
jgi:hypothetical protein